MNKFSRLDRPLCLPVNAKKLESEHTVTLEIILPDELHIEIIPGQYFMIWNPGDDEIPISISNVIDNRLLFTVCSVGKTSNNLIQKQIDDLIGIRGPFGNGFTISPSKSCSIIVAGGMGVAPLRFLLYNLTNNPNKKVILIQGAKTERELYFQDEFDSLDIDRYYCTDDGSFGLQDFPTAILEKYLSECDTNSVEIFSCGPEIMLKNILGIVNKFNLANMTQISLADRHIRCGFGICGSCYMDGLGLSVCKDGPVFTGDILLKLDDFGKWGRTPDGSKYSLVQESYKSL
ncbi:MAG: iron-sulfur cluster-binding protein [Candidatus Hodarchaeales archaeon]